MNPLNILGSLLGFASGGLGWILKIPFLLKLIRNYSVVQKCLEDIFQAVHSARDNGGLPSIEDTRKIIGAAALIFEKDLIDLPDLDEVRFAEQLRSIESELVKAIEIQRKAKGLL